MKIKQTSEGEMDCGVLGKLSGVNKGKYGVALEYWLWLLSLTAETLIMWMFIFAFEASLLANLNLDTTVMARTVWCTGPRVMMQATYILQYYNPEFHWNIFYRNEMLNKIDIFCKTIQDKNSSHASKKLDLVVLSFNISRYWHLQNPLSFKNNF